MNSALIGVFGIICFILAYKFYGEYLSQKIFNLKQLDLNEVKTPAHEYRDGEDYLPTDKQILIGHHFSSIAGAAPIVGPAVAAIWGWLPAMIWIILGVIFMGSAHDFGALVISMKHKGQSIGSVCEEILGKKAKVVFLTIIFFLVWMVIAVFALVIANLFISFPSSVIPVNFEIIIAILMGLFINRGDKSLKIPSIIAQLTLFLMIYLGTLYPISLKPLLGEHELFGWIIFLLIYSFIASILPVWLLLQPRDYINSHQLFVGLTLMVLGLIIGQPKIVAPAINFDPIGAPPIFPFLFITIACGAISGFHGLVSGGTSSKQVNKWKDAKPVGYGSMLGEGLLALLATLAVTAGFKTSAHWHAHYASWNAANGLSAKINAFVIGSGQFLESLGISGDISKTVIAVLIISFAATSLDTACRIQRYIIGEVGESLKIKSLQNKYIGSSIAILSAFILMITNSGGKGGLYLWPLFGATNQMLAGLTLLVIAVYLNKKKIKNLSFLIPSLIIIFLTLISLFYNIKIYINSKNYFLTTLGLILSLAQITVCIIATKTIINNKRIRND